MKHVLLVGLFLFGAAAQAQSIVVANESLGYGPSYYNNINFDYRAEFNIDKDLGRAWVEVKFTGSSRHNAQTPYLDGRWLVDGLRYDTASKQIYYNDTVVAAVKPGFLGFEQIVNASGVSLDLNIVDEQVDDGFNVSKAPFEVVTLQIP